MQKDITVFLFSILLLIQSAPYSRAAESAAPVSLSMSELNRRIETRRGNWIGLKGHVMMEFIAGHGQKESCNGELTYQRLDEKILLQCFNEDAELIFAFRTSDREFQFYIPSVHTLFEGNIFDLENSPKLNSHLRAQDLYRALKPMAVPEQNGELSFEDGKPATLEIKRKTSGGGVFLFRQLVISSDGDVIEEAYYTPEENISLSVTRSKFEEIPQEKDGRKIPAVFPRQIEINSSRETFGAHGFNKTILHFTKLEFLDAITESELQISLPKGTTRIVLDDGIGLQPPSLPSPER